MGLFDTPDQIRQAQQAQLMQQYRAGDMVGAAAAGLGNTLTKAAGYGLFDIDPRSKEEIQAQKLQGMMQGLDMGDNASIESHMNKLNKGGFQPQAMQLAGLLRTPATPAKPNYSFQEILNEKTGKNEVHVFENGKFSHVAGSKAPKSTKPHYSYQKIYNEKKKKNEVHVFENGKFSHVAGDAPPDEDGVAWQYKSTLELPPELGGGEVLARFNPADETAAGMQIYTEGPEGKGVWVQAPPNLQRPVTRTQDVPISREATTTGKQRAFEMIQTDPVLSAQFSGLSITEQDQLADRVADLAEKLKKDNRSLSHEQARDKAILYAKLYWTKPGNRFGGIIPYDWARGMDLKTPEEIEAMTKELEDDQTFRIIVPSN